MKMKYLSAVIFLTAVTPAFAQPTYSISRLGLTGSLYTNQVGGITQHTSLLGLFGTTQSPVGCGTSTAFYSQQTSLATEHAWIWTPSTGSFAVGPTDSEHTSLAGLRASAPLVADNTGLIAGTAQRYSQTMEATLGESAWAWTSLGGRVRIGLVGTGYTNAAQRQASRPLAAGGGYVGGRSDYFGSSSDFQSLHAWTWSPTSGTVRVGLFSSDYSNPSSRQFSTLTHMTESGIAAGHSARFAGTDNEGRDAWTWNATSGTTRIGLIDPEFVSSNGTRFSTPETTSGTGYVGGYSNRYSGSLFPQGQVAWIANPAGVTQRLGLNDPSHTSPQGFQDSSVQTINSNGVAGGRSGRYLAGGANGGASAWIQPFGGSATQVGLTAGEHTNSNGIRQSSVGFINSSSVAVGGSTSYFPNSNVGSSAWRWTSGGGTERLGFYNGFYVSTNNGITQSAAIGLNEAGQVAGYSMNYEFPFGGGRQRAWFFDPVSSQTILITLNVPHDPVFWITEPALLTEDGFVFGRYNSALPGTTTKAFAWSLETGFFDLGMQVSGGLGQDFWERLSGVRSTIRSSFVAGLGVRSDVGGSIYYVLQVPAPSSALAIVSIASMIVLRRRK